MNETKAIESMGHIASIDTGIPIEDRDHTAIEHLWALVMRVDYDTQED